MELQFPSEQQNRVEAFGRKHRTGLAALVFTDMVGSTALKQQLGDRAAADFFRMHHELIRETLRQFAHAEEVETAGDSFFLIFATPSEAVHFALLAQSRLKHLVVKGGTKPLDRIGIHVGEVVVDQEADGPNSKGLFGIQIDTCARVMSLAKAGQTLLTRGAFDSARQVLKGGDIPGVGELEWLNHGPYMLQGLEEAVEICEVREAGQPRGDPPTSSDKAQRQVRADEEPVLGWRPAVSQTIPNTRWVLEKKLGEGGFGEVWLGRNSTTRQAHVFKFCFRADRVRFLKRELTLFRLLQERVGNHVNIVPIHDVYLDKPPFYVEMDFVEGADLRNWCEGHGGVDKLSLHTRLDIIAQAADGLQAAHEAGVIHRDIKPANILIGGKGTAPGEVRVKLTDFGIGQVVSEEYLKNITRAGFTQTILAESSSSRTGTQLYMAPELLAGKPASLRSDIYSLGVVLYQLLVGEFGRPVTTDWAKDIADPLLRDDLQHCFAGHPADRFVSAGELAKKLRALPERRQERAREEAERLAIERVAYRRGMMRAVGITAVIIVLIAVLAVVAFQQSRQAKAAAAAEKQERLLAQRHLYTANMNLAQQAWRQNNVGRVRQLLEETASYPERGFEWYYWQRQTRQELETLRGHLGEIWCLAISADGQRIVTGSEDTTAKIWDAATGKEVATLKGHSGPIKAVAFSPDARLIVTGSLDTTAKVWEVPSGKELHTLRGHTGPISSLAFSPDGARIVTASGDHTGKVWDATTGQELHTLNGHSDWIGAVVFSPDGRRIVTASNDNTAKMWDTATGTNVVTLGGHRGPIYALAFSPDGQWIITGSDDRTARLWEGATGKEKRTLSGHNASVYSVAFSPESRRVVTGSSDSSAILWEVSTGRHLQNLRSHRAWIHSVAFSRDGQRILTASEDHTAKVWDAASGTELRNLKGHGGRLWCATFFPDSHRIVTGSMDQTAKLWDIARESGLVVLRGHTNSVNSVVFSPDGQRIASGSVDRKALVWDAATGRQLLSFTGHTAGIRAVAFSPDGKTIITGSGDRTAKLWESSTGKEVRPLDAHNGSVNSVSFSSDGQRMATAGGLGDGTVKVWETGTFKQLRTIKGYSSGINGVAFSPDGGRVAVAGEASTATVWDVGSGKLLATLRGHSGPIYSIAFSHDGRKLISGSFDQTGRVWDAASGKQLLTLTGHGGRVLSAAFSLDGQRIVTGSDDSTAKIWDAVTGKELLTLEGHRGPVNSAAFSPAGEAIATGSYDQQVNLWKGASRQEVAQWQAEDAATHEYLAERRRQQTAANQHEHALRMQDPGVIKQWLVLAPIPFEGGNGTAALDQAQIPREEDLSARAGERIKVGQSERVWSELRLDDYVIDFNELLGEVTQFSVGYALCYIQSKTAQPGLKLKIGSDDQSKIYLNGKMVYRHGEWRNYVPDQDVVEAGVDLKAGINVLVFKVVNDIDAWQGSVRFTDAAGQPLKDIQVTLDPEGKDLR